MQEIPRLEKEERKKKPQNIYKKINYRTKY